LSKYITVAHDIFYSRCGPLNATNTLKHLIDQSEERILLIDQSKNASKRLHQDSNINLKGILQFSFIF